MTAAQAAAAELNIKLEVDTIRAALAYERGQLPRIALKSAGALIAFLLLLIAINRGACTPGGMLEPTSSGDCTSGPDGSFFWKSIGMFVLVLSAHWNGAAERGEIIPRCSRPIYPLLELLTTSATVARPTTRYTEGIKLSQQVSHLGLPLRTLARHAAADFGKRRALRSALATHLSRVDATFIEAADRLVADRAASAKRLAELAAVTANNIAAGRFTELLPAEALAEEAAVEPDRLDGRRLASACLWAAAIVIVSFLGLSSLGAPAELLVPLALVAFLVIVYALLAFLHGLSEATRLTRSIGGFFSPSPPM